MKPVVAAIAVGLIGCAPAPADSGGDDSGVSSDQAPARVDAGRLPDARVFTRDGGTERDATEPVSVAEGGCDATDACGDSGPASGCAGAGADACAPRCGDGIVETGEQCDGDGLGHGGETSECDLDCTLSLCGDGVVNASAGETCDDGDGDDTDDCPDGPFGSCITATCTDGLLHSAGTGSESDVDCGGLDCAACPGELSLTEVAVTPTPGEFVEIHNPGATPVSLTHVFLADTTKYAEIASGSAGVAASDFVARFPDGAVIDAGAYVVVSLESATAFRGIYGRNPDYDLDPDDPGAPDMIGVFGASSGLTNAHEVVVMFAWDGRSATVRDLDYLLYGDASDAVDKAGVVVSGVAYAPDTPTNLQAFGPAPDTNGETLIRCDPSEGTEPKSGGNGWLGHDETGENLDATWRVSRTASPGAPNACP